MKTTVLTPPDGEPVSLSAAKDYLRIGHDGEDVLISLLIKSARARLEAELGMALVSRVLKVQLDAWPASLSRRGLRLEPGPIADLTSVVVESASGEREDVTARFDVRGGRLRLRSWAFVSSVPVGGHIEIVFETGFGAVEAVPDDLVLAVKMLTAQAYRLRDGGPDGAEDALPVEIDDLLAPYMGVRL